MLFSFTQLSMLNIEHCFSFFQIVGNGNIIVGGIIEMTSMQKTFSIALSQQMSPSARIIAYTIRDNEIMADGINFFVNGSRVNDVSSYSSNCIVIHCPRIQSYIFGPGS